MINRILASTGTMVTMLEDKSYREIKEIAACVNADGYEFMLYPTHYPDEADLIQSISGLNCPTMHVEKRIMERFFTEENGKRDASQKYEANCRVAREIGAKLLVLHLWNGMPSDEHFGENLAAFGEFREIAKEYGVTLTVENIPCRFSDPFRHFYELCEKYDDVSFTIDTKFLLFHNQFDELLSDKSSWIWKRVRHIHSNDYGGAYHDWSNMKTLHIGEGNVDFKRLFAYLKSLGYDGDFTLECGSIRADGLDTDKLNADITKIRELCKGAGL